MSNSTMRQGNSDFENLDRRDVQIAGVGRDRRRAVVAVAAAIGGAEDFVLQRRLARPAAVLPRDQHGAARAAIGERALGAERRQRFEDHVGELLVRRLIGADRRRRAGIGDGVGRVDEVHHVAHAVVECQLRIERADQRIEHAGLDHRRPQIDRPLGLAVALGEIEGDIAALDAHRAGKTHRPVELDAVIVHEAFGGSFAVGQRLDRRAQFGGGAGEQRRERVHHRRCAEPLAGLQNARRAHLGRRHLRMHVAAHQFGLAAVGEDEAFEIVVVDAARIDFHRRQQQALLEDFRCVGRSRARIGAADIGLVGDRSGEADQRRA